MNANLIGSHTLTTQQKFGIGIFFVVGMTTSVFAYYRLNKLIASPFYRPVGAAYKSPEEKEQEQIAALKIKDTDKDGVSDYDEMYVYRTSAFLEDTDSDGFKDGDEIAQGYDPNCPKGQTCRSARAPVSDAAEPKPAGPPDGSISLDGAPAAQDAASSRDLAALKAMTEVFGDVESLTAAQLAQKIDALGSAQLRDFLVKSGIPQEMLQRLDDATLRALLKETAAETLVKSSEAAAGSP